MRQTRVWISIVLAGLLLIQQTIATPMLNICDTSSHTQASVIVTDEAGEIANPVHSHHHHEHGDQAEKAKCQKCDSQL